MTDQTARERAAERTQPPNSILMASPKGGIVACLVDDVGRVVGAVWMAADRTSVPRAGIVNVPDPDGPFQQVWGLRTLEQRRNDSVDAAEWLAEQRAATVGQYQLREVVSYPDLDAVRRVTGLLP